MERHDLLLFNDVFRPFKSRGGRSAVTPEDLVRLTSTKDGVAEAAVDRMPPTVCTELLGRDKIVKRLAKLVFERNESQIKLYGPEGSGKTSVATEFVAMHRDKFPGGVVWLNGSFMVWDVHHFLVEEARQFELTDHLGLDDLRENLWRYLFQNEQRWLVVIDDASDDALEWVPPPKLSTGKGVVLITSKAKSGRDEALRVELPLLDARSTVDLMKRAAGKRLRKSVARSSTRRLEEQALLQLSDQAHLCRSVLSMRVAGYIVREFDITFASLLERYDFLMSRTIMPDLKAILTRYKLRHHMSSLRNVGVIDTADFLRGRPWTALKSLSTKESYQFEKIQENLFRSRNRLSLKLLCKIWRDLLKDPQEMRGRHMWEILRACSFFNATYIPAELIAAEMAASGFTDSLLPSPLEEDLVYRTKDGTICIHPTLLDAVRSIHEKGTESNRTCARRVLTSLHTYCMDNVFPLHRGVGAADPNMLNAVMSMLPHLFMAVGMCRELLDEQLKEEVSVPGGTSARTRSRRGLSGATASSRSSRSFKGSKKTQEEDAELDDEEDDDDATEEDPLPETLTRGSSSASTGSRLRNHESQSSTKEDFALMRLQRRHSLFSVASGASSVSAKSPRSSISASSVGSLQSDSLTTSRGSSSEGNGGKQIAAKPLLRSLTRRFTQRSKRGIMTLLLADLTAMQAFMLLLIPLGDFRLRRAQVFAQDALVAYQQLDDRAGEASMHYMLGHVHFRSGRLPAAVDAWIAAEELAHDAAAKNFAKSSSALALAEQGEVGLALSALSDASHAAGDSSLMAARTWTVMGYVYLLADQLDDSRSAFQRALDIQESASPMSLVLAETEGLMASVALQDGDAPAALTHAEEALSVFTAADAPSEHHIARVYLNLGAIYESQQKFEQAASAIQQSIAHSDELFGGLVPSPVNAARQRALADVLARAGDRDEASEVLSQVRKMTRTMRTWSNLYKQYTNNRKSVRGSSATADA
ncbi:Hypothetical Protein FCC1311_016512 [Hondaea fermentalgiana]|uniref:NB-ARC domain-containing protein n=1 Tax=Hondaea fermentalgiana TaxID=2315210 RepID=A0A2R5GA63_9STRA|nr:Hypothetical Protein FCC1311_016512 [Hondaea fermentalgiana]|eukprot:GBG25433.1 Hypothetical Protein FCC1311_016512 [Hondaea fermentalgiana]